MTRDFLHKFTVSKFLVNDNFDLVTNYIITMPNTKRSHWYSVRTEILSRFSHRLKFNSTFNVLENTIQSKTRIPPLPHGEHGSHLTHRPLDRPQSTQQTATRSVQPFLQNWCSILPIRYLAPPTPPQIAPSNTSFLGSVTRNSISIHPTVFYTILARYQRTDRQTDRRDRTDTELDLYLYSRYRCIADHTGYFAQGGVRSIMMST